MDRLRSKERQIIDWFIQNFCGRINLASSSWTAWKSLIISFFESCDTIKQQYSRKGQLDIVREIDTIGPTLVKNILTVVEDSSYFPVSKFYKNKTLQFVQLTFEDYVVSGLEFKEEEEVPINDLKDSKFAFKMHSLSSQEISMIEECRDPMGNEDSTTGLVTWQGAYVLHNWITLNTSWIFNPGTKVLELGSGAGLFGLGLLKSEIEMQQYIFSDVHLDVLSAIVANVKLNFLLDETRKKENLTSWLEHGPPKVVTMEKKNDCENDDDDAATFMSQDLIRNDSVTNVQVKYLDWLNCSESQIKALDFNLILGSDLTYDRQMLGPLALLFKRLISEKNCDAFIACTKRQFDTISIFLQHLSDVGLEAQQVFAVTLGPGDNIINTHESLHKVFIYRLYSSSPSSS